jgi:hypothetical protein
MRRLALAALGASLALPAMAQPSDWQQQVQGLFTGNKNADDAVRQAYERGYQRGRDDEGRMNRRANNTNQRGSDSNNQRGYDSNNPRYDNNNQSRPPQPTYSR